MTDEAIDDAPPPGIAGWVSRLVVRHRATLVAVAKREGARDEDALDCVQDAFETFLAMDDSCPHQGGPLGEGELAGTVVTCPWHEWRFDARTGVNTDDATCKVKTYPVKLEGGSVLVEL